MGRGRNDAPPQRPQGGDHFHGARSPHQMTVEGLGGTDGNTCRPISKNDPEGPGFHPIPHHRPGPMSIDGIHLVRRQVSHAQGFLNGAGLSPGIGLGNVPRVGGISVPHDFGQDGGPPRLRRTFSLQHQRPCPFAQNEPGTIPGKRATGGFRVHGIGFGQGLERFPGFHHALGQQSLASPGQGITDPSMPHREEGFAQRHRRGGAGGTVGKTGTPDLEFDAQLPRRSIRHESHDGGGARTGLGIQKRFMIGLLEGGGSSDASSPEQSAVQTFLPGKVQARLGQCFPRRQQGQLGHPVEGQATQLGKTGFHGGQNGCRQGGVQRTGPGNLQETDTGTPCLQAQNQCLNPFPEGAEGAHARHDDALRACRVCIHERESIKNRLEKRGISLLRPE